MASLALSRTCNSSSDSWGMSSSKDWYSFILCSRGRSPPSLVVQAKRKRQWANHIPDNIVPMPAQPRKRDEKMRQNYKELELIRCLFWNWRVKNWLIPSCGSFFSSLVPSLWIQLCFGRCNRGESSIHHQHGTWTKFGNKRVVYVCKLECWINLSRSKGEPVAIPGKLISGHRKLYHASWADATRTIMDTT